MIMCAHWILLKVTDPCSAFILADTAVIHVSVQFACLLEHGESKWVEV